MEREGVTTAVKYVNCVRRSYLVEDRSKFNQQGRASLFTVSLRPQDAELFSLNMGFVYKHVGANTRRSGAGEISHLESLIETGMRSAYGPEVEPTAFSNNIAFPLDYRLDGKARISGFVVPRAPDQFFRPAQHNADRRPQCFSHAIFDARRQKISEQSLVEIVRKLSGSVARFHALGFVHGDLSANNVLCSLGERNSIFLVDCDGANDLLLRHGENGRTKHWTDPRVETGLVKAHDVQSDRYNLALFALRAACLDFELDHEDYATLRDDLVKKSPSELIRLWDATFEDPFLPSRPEAREWLELTTEMADAEASFASRSRFRFADRAKSAATTTAVDPRVAAKGNVRSHGSHPGKDSTAPQPATGTLRARIRVALAGSREQRAAAVQELPERARLHLSSALLLSWVPFALILIAADTPLLGWGSLRVAASYLPVVGAIFLATTAISIVGLALRHYGCSTFGSEKARSLYAVPGWPSIGTTIVLIAPVAVIGHAVTEFSGQPYIPQMTVAFAIASVAILLSATGVATLLFACVSAESRLARSSGLMFVEAAVAGAVAILVISLHASELRLAENRVYDESVLAARSEGDCRITAAVRPERFRQWRQSDISCRRDSVQIRRMVLESTAATKAFGGQRARAVTSRSKSDAARCYSKSGAYDGHWFLSDAPDNFLGKLICYSQGPRSVIEWTDNAGQRYGRMSARMSRRSVYRYWKQNR